MALVRRDEVLEKALSTDESAIPRFNIIAEDGSVLHRNARLELANNILTPGTPINKVALDEILAASGVTGGTSTAYTLAQDNFTLADGAPVRFRIHAASGSPATLNINSTGAKAIKTVTNGDMPAAIPAGMWLDAVYSASAGAYILTGGSVSAAQMAAWDAKTTQAEAKSIAAAQSKVISTTRITTAAKQIDITVPSGYARYRLVGAGISVDYSQDDNLDPPAWNLKLKANASTISARVYARRSSVTTITNCTDGEIGRLPASRPENSTCFQVDIFKKNSNWAGMFNGNGSSYDGTAGGPSGFCYGSFTSTSITKLSLISADNITAGMLMLEGLA